jgi:beta-mannosidase
MGTLYWQLNDCWPVVSWSSIDSKYRRKALYYAAQNAFRPVILSVAPEKDDLVFYIVSDLQHDISGNITLRWEDFTGQLIDEKVFKATVVPENTSQTFHRLPKTIFEDYLTTSMLTLYFDTLSVSLFDTLNISGDQQGAIARKIYYFVPPKLLELPDYQLDITVEEVNNHYEITIVGDGTLVKNLYLYTEPEIEGVFSDNFFDLLPNESKTLTFKPINPVSEFQKQLKTLSLKEAK